MIWWWISRGLRRRLAWPWTDTYLDRDLHDRDPEAWGRLMAWERGL